MPSLRNPLLAALAAFAPLAAQDRGDAEPLQLETLDGVRWTAAALSEAKAVVLAWTGLDCPMAKVYRPRLVEIAAEFEDARVFLVHSNAHEAMDAIEQRASRDAGPLAIVYDAGGRLARRFGATRTTEVVVLGPSGDVCYQGAIDDQYGYRRDGGTVGTYRKDGPSRHFLRDALRRVIAGELVVPARTDPLGCALDLGWEERAPDERAMPFFGEVERIVRERCAVCHHRGGSAPFALETYADARAHAETIREVVEDRRMPPWNANPEFGHFKNDRSLTEAQIDAIVAWVEDGVASGDPARALPPAIWPAGWEIGEPDVVFEAPAELVPATGRLPYRYVMVRTNFAEDRWVRAAQVRSTAGEVVHHVLVFVLEPRGLGRPKQRPWTPEWNVMDLFRHLPPDARRRHMLRNQPYLRDLRKAGGGLFGFFIAALSGDGPTVLPEGTAAWLPAGATLVFQIHYAPNGIAQESKTELALAFADGPPRAVRDVHAVSSVTFEIPPGDPEYVFEVAHRFQRGGRIMSLAPHMHYRGKSFRYVLERLDGTEEVLLDVPRYDFDWQLQYQLAEPVRVERGERLRVIATFDNSERNPYNPDPEKTVYFGLQTDEEMLIGYFEVVWDAQ